MFVKICGITRVEDAEAAVASGANALGFVFWPQSPRFIDPYRARAIVLTLPPFVSAVGVFVNQTSEYVNGVAALVRLSAIQFHGEESESYVRTFAQPILKAIAVGDWVNLVGIDSWPARVTLLLDARDPLCRGGTGRTIDWMVASTIAARRRSILAGGLKPENVAEAIARVRPFGIDVSSGVESSPGVKDRSRMRALFEALA